MKTAVLLDFVLPAVFGLAIFGAMTFFANSILHPGLLVDDGTVWAGATNSTTPVNATVMVQSIAVTVADASIAYGSLALSGTQTTIALSDTQTGTNSGTVTEDFNAIGSDTLNWTLATSTIGSEQYLHEYTTNGGSLYATLDQTAYETLRTGVRDEGGSDTATFDFRITVPSSTASLGVTQNADLTIQATAT